MGNLVVDDGRDILLRKLLKIGQEILHSFCLLVVGKSLHYCLGRLVISELLYLRLGKTNRPYGKCWRGLVIHILVPALDLI